MSFPPVVVIGESLSIRAPAPVSVFAAPFTI
jgi:hypothetical protein